MDFIWMKKKMSVKIVIQILTFARAVTMNNVLPVIKVTILMAITNAQVAQNSIKTVKFVAQITVLLVLKESLVI